MSKAARVVKVSKDIMAELMVITEDQKVTFFSEPGRDGFRTIVVNDGLKVRGMLWGSRDEAIPQERDYCLQGSSEIEASCQPEVEIGRKLIMMFPIPSYPQVKYVKISEKPVKSIVVKWR